MAEKTFRVYIYSPDETIGEYEASLLVCPASDGELGVMADHSPMLCALKSGQCRITTAEGKVFADISNGFLSVENNVAEIFVE